MEKNLTQKVRELVADADAIEMAHFLNKLPPGQLYDLMAKARAMTFSQKRSGKSTRRETVGRRREDVAHDHRDVVLSRGFEEPVMTTQADREWMEQNNVEGGNGKITYTVKVAVCSVCGRVLDPFGVQGPLVKGAGLWGKILEDQPK